MALLSGTATVEPTPDVGSDAPPPSGPRLRIQRPPPSNQLLYSNALNTVSGLATGNNGVLITSAGGVPSISSHITCDGPGQHYQPWHGRFRVWNGTSIALANGGTNANLTATTGGIVYSGASAMAILAARLPHAFPSSGADGGADMGNDPAACQRQFWRYPLLLFDHRRNFHGDPYRPWRDPRGRLWQLACSHGRRHNRAGIHRRNGSRPRVV